MASQISQIEARTVKITAQGHLLTVRPEPVKLDNSPRGDRQATNEFTPRARLNLLKTFAQIKAPNSKGYRSKVSMLTLTMRDKVHAREAKRLFFVFLKRWRRKYTSLSGIWKMEFQRRGAPHFHMILYNAGYISKDHIRQVWGDVIGQEKPFTRIERIKSYRQGMSYVAKYLGKIEDTGFNNRSNLTVDKETGEMVQMSVGRHWGVFNRLHIPWANETTETIALDGSWWLIRRYCSDFWSLLAERDMYGFSIFTDEPELALNHIVALADSYRASLTIN